MASEGKRETDVEDMVEEGEVVDASLMDRKRESDLEKKDSKSKKQRRSEEDRERKHRSKHRRKHREHRKHRKERKEDGHGSKEGENRENDVKLQDDLEEGQIPEARHGGIDSDAESGEIKSEAIGLEKQKLDDDVKDRLLFAPGSGDAAMLAVEGKRQPNESLRKGDRVSVRNGEPVALQSVLNIASAYGSDGDDSEKSVEPGADVNKDQRTTKLEAGRKRDDGRKREDDAAGDAADCHRKGRKESEREGHHVEGKEKLVAGAKDRKERRGDLDTTKQDKQKKERGERITENGGERADSDNKKGSMEEKVLLTGGRHSERSSREDVSVIDSIGKDDHHVVSKARSKDEHKDGKEEEHRGKRGNSRRHASDALKDVERDAKRHKPGSPRKEASRKATGMSPPPARTPPLRESQDRRDNIKNSDSPKDMDRGHRRRSSSRDSTRDRRRDRSPSKEERSRPARSPLHDRRTEDHSDARLDRATSKDRHIDERDYRRRDRSASKDRQMQEREYRKRDRSTSIDRHIDDREYRRRDRSPSRDRHSERDYRRDRDGAGLRDGRSRADGRDISFRGGNRARDAGEGRRNDDRNDRRYGDRRDRYGGRRKDEDEKDRENKEKRDRAREEENEEQYAQRVATQLKAQEEEQDPEKIKEESRRRRQAILEKYKKLKQQESEGPGAGVLDGTGAPEPTTQAGVTNGELLEAAAAGKAAASREADSAASPSAVSLTDGMSAAEAAAYVEEPARIANGRVVGEYANLAGQTLEEGRPTAVQSSKPANTSTKKNASVDMFSDDIFGESPAGGQKMVKLDGTAQENSGLTDNWDDAEGYYTFRIGEVLDGRYEVASSHGRGVFSTVVKAWDLKPGPNDPEEVAIKIIRSNETMYKAGQQELVILNKLSGADVENRRHCIRLYSSFEYRQHLCLVFESLHMNLREILKKFGRNIGINLTAVRSYAAQLLISLKHLRNCGVLHCDIKPDNMLVNEAKNVLKLADFGSAMFAGENEITPYLVSRFYRAPEIMLGLPYDHALDMWSVGCCLYEMYTGKILFPGRTNNDMLRLHMEMKGLFPKKLLKKAAFVEQHFDSDFNFCALEDDPVTKKTVKRIITNVHPKDMGALLAGPGTAEEDPKMVAAFKDLLEKMFVLDPAKRINVSQALNHPFILGK